MKPFLERRPTKAGTSFRVKWQQDGRTQSETFGPGRELAARRFLLDVEEHGNRWPDGWSPGFGYTHLSGPTSTPTAAAEPTPSLTPLLGYALAFVRDKTGIQPDTRARYARQVPVLAAQLDAIVDADEESDANFASLEGLTHRHVARWINGREAAGASPKTIANWHGLLFQIMDSAVTDRLRPSNPCATTGKALPRRDAYRTEDRHTYLTEAEFALIADAMWPGLPDPANGGVITAVGTRRDRDHLIVAVGTGARWGEQTALTVADYLRRGAAHEVNIQRSWKANPAGEYARPGVGRRYLGSPKTIRGRRRIRVGGAVAAALDRLTAGREPADLLLTGTRGGPVDQPHFYVYRWQRAVALAQRNGLTKSPRFHDLRHTYAAWLISANVPLPEIQRRLGHESIQTTVDTYGGLLQQAGDLADKAIDAALRWDVDDREEPDTGAQAS